MARPLPMFPLGTVLFPHMVLPLHVFEPRYRTLMERLEALHPSEREFGVVRTGRDHEVGPGGPREDVGTVARVVQAERLEDGRWVAVAVGTRRLRVVEWLPDDPYPCALIEELAEEGVDPPEATTRDALLVRLRRLLAMRAELGIDGTPSTFDVADDAAIAAWQLAVLTPLLPAQAQEVLATDGWGARLDRVAAALGPLEREAERTLRGG